jgi:hypothetical protein
MLISFKTIKLLIDKIEFLSRTSMNIELITKVLQTSKLSNHQTYTKNPKMKYNQTMDLERATSNPMKKNLATHGGYGTLYCIREIHSLSVVSCWTKFPRTKNPNSCLISEESTLWMRGSAPI